MGSTPSTCTIPMSFKVGYRPLGAEMERNDLPTGPSLLGGPNGLTARSLYLLGAGSIPAPSTSDMLYTMALPAIAAVASRIGGSKVLGQFAATQGAKGLLSGGGAEGGDGGGGMIPNPMEKIGEIGSQIMSAADDDLPGF